MKFFKRSNRNTPAEPLLIYSPVSGTARDVREAPDPMFSSEALGKGASIEASASEITAPVSGTITTFFQTGHAVGITSSDGAEVLIHVGVDTVELNGRHFTPAKKQGDKVRRGELLLTADMAAIKKEGYDPTVMLVITNSGDYSEIICKAGQTDPSAAVLEIHRA